MKENNMNPLTQIDFYKADHRRQYPDGTNLVYSNFTARSNSLSNLPDNNDGIVFFGLQHYIKFFLIDSFNNGFFNKDKDAVVKEYKRRMDNALGKDAVPVEHIGALHDLGYLPIEIRALGEGTYVPIKVPVLTIHNTHPDFFWLVNYLETSISCELWKACVSATTAKWYKDLFDSYAHKTSDNIDFTGFQGHDFSFRGMSGVHDAALSGAAHLTSFYGTDTIPAIDLLEDYYHADSDLELIGCSVPATEHSVMAMGSKDGEIETFKRLIFDLYPKGIVSVVSDTWDLWKVLTEYLPLLKDDIMARDGKVVIRPDSGDPVDIICGIKDTRKVFDLFECPDKETMLEYAEEYLHDKICEETAHGEYGGDITEDIIWNGDVYTLTYSPDWNRHDKEYYYIDNYGDKTPSIDKVVPLVTTPSEKGCIELLWDIFGGTINSKGYKELSQKIGLIYGDSITPARAKQIMERLESKGFSSTNVVLGIGSFTYQYNTRDTYGFAMKATYGEVDGVGRNIFKDPVTDNGIKKSATGLLKVTNGVLYDNQDKNVESDLKTIFKDGSLVKETSLSEIRKRLKNA
jgi:nicotinamide phosphoribosyltransferase